MISSEAFMLANLVLWIVILAWIGIAERRGRHSFDSMHRGIRYRRMDTMTALKLIRDQHGVQRRRSEADKN